ncbi:MAG TPA: hypothetical protein VKE94_01645, partial [Gemmataceae bacterium]|nr:hypothetical protein [Gemmataceae bacterium]
MLGPHRRRHPLLHQFLPNRLGQLAALVGFFPVTEPVKCFGLSLDRIGTTRIDAETLIKPGDCFLTESLSQQSLPFFKGSINVSKLVRNVGNQHLHALLYEQGTRQLPQHLNRRAPNEHKWQPGAANGAHNDQVGMSSSRPLHDLVGRITAEDVLLPRDPLEIKVT